MISRSQRSQLGFIFSSLALLLIFILSGCNNDSDTSSTPQDGNQQPTAKITASLVSTAGKTVTLDGSNSSDPDGDALNFRWEQIEGPEVTLSGVSTATLSFVAPTVSQSTQFTFQLTVDDGDLSSTASVSFQLSPSDTNPDQPNQQPYAMITAPEAATSGQTVTLNGSGSSDPDGDNLSYKWAQTGGADIVLSNSTSSTLTFVAPTVSQTTKFTFQLTVTDGALSSSASASIQVTPRTTTNQQPSAKITAPQTATSGQTVTLNGSDSTDPDGGTLSYQWKQTEGPDIVLSSSSSSSLTFVAPAVTQTTQITFQLTVNDGELSNSASVSMQISPMGGNTSPTCATAEENNSLTLSCPAGEVITEVEFASYGNPGGECGSFTTGSCNASNSVTAVSDACKGKNSCTLYAGNDTFGGNPCEGTAKKLATEVACGTATDPNLDADGRLWHPLTLTFTGPKTDEKAEPNPFYNYRLDVTFKQGDREVVVPGYFAADGDAANTSATSGDKWRVHFVPDTIGEWTYSVSFRQGDKVSVSDDPLAGEPVAPDGITGSLTIGPTDKTGRDNRYQGTLEYVGEHYARFKGTGEYFILMGSQSPENFLGYGEFDNTVDHGGGGGDMKDGVHWYEPHIKDWRPGDPTWKDGKGKGIIGALNYLASKGMNFYYSLFMNVDGDCRETYPFIDYREYERYDVSKLAQWEIVLSHGDTLGMMLMVITEEEESEQLLKKVSDPIRRLYLRELIARFSHHHALQWDLCEEADKHNYNSTQDLKDEANYIRKLDPYDHPIQWVQYKGEYMKDSQTYGRMLGFPNFDAVALQNDPEASSKYTKKWVDESAAAGHKWLVGLIEANLGNKGVPPDDVDFWHDSIRKDCVWANLMAGGSGSGFYYGEKYPNSDNDCEDFRPRDNLFVLMDHARQFFVKYLPFWEMAHADDLVSGNDDFVYAKQGDIYAIYLKEGGSPTLDLSNASGNFTVQWYDPRNGGELQESDVKMVTGGSKQSLGNPPEESGKDWAVLVKREGL